MSDVEWLSDGGDESRGSSADEIGQHGGWGMAETAKPKVKKARPKHKHKHSKKQHKHHKKTMKKKKKSRSKSPQKKKVKKKTQKRPVVSESSSDSAEESASGSDEASESSASEKKKKKKKRSFSSKGNAKKKVRHALLKDSASDSSSSSSSSSSEGEESDSDVEECVYGNECYRKNPSHYLDFSHPADHATASKMRRKAKAQSKGKGGKGKGTGKPKVFTCRRDECKPNKPCGLRVEVLEKTSAPYRKVLGMLKSSNGHGFVFPAVQRIKHVTHTNLDAKLKASKGATSVTTLWHGTKYNAVTSILHGGFRLPTHDRGMWGRGLYFARDSSKSWQYSKKHNSNVVVLCDVAVGKSYCPTGGAQPMLKASTVFAKGCASLWAKAGTSVMYDEYVVYKTAQATVRYIIEFEREKKTVKLPACPNAGCYDVTPAHTAAYSHPLH